MGLDARNALHRGEGVLTRVFDLCHGCRLCFEFCASFPTLFEMIDKHDDQDAGWMTPAEQDQVVDECFQCKLCYINCPYIPELHEWNVDFPRLMLRADAMQHTNDIKSSRDKATTRIMGHTDLFGRLATSTGPIARCWRVYDWIRSALASTADKVSGSPTGISMSSTRLRSLIGYSTRPAIAVSKTSR